MENNRLHLIPLCALLLICFCFCEKPTQTDEPIVPEDPEDTTIVDPVIPDDTIPTPFITDSTKVILSFNGDSGLLAINPFPELINIDTIGNTLSINSTAKDMGFELSGIASDVSIHINTLYQASIILDGISLNSSNNANLIDIESTERCILQINDSTSNVLIDKGTDADTTKACIHSTGALAVMGEGKLEINTSIHHGINGKGGVSILGGNMIIAAGKDGIHSHGHATIDGGNVNIVSGDDGIQVKDGYISVSDGTLAVQCVNDGLTAAIDEDSTATPFINLSGGIVGITTTGTKGMGIDAEANLHISGGTHTIKVSGAASKALKCGKDMSISGGEIHLYADGGVLYDDTEEDLSSAAGIKCDGILLIDGENTILDVNCGGNGAKGLNVEGNLSIKNGQIKVISTGSIASMKDSTASPKAIKCDGSITVRGGDIYAQSNHSHAMEAVGNIYIYGGSTCCFGGAEDKKCGLKTDGYLLIATPSDSSSTGPTVIAFGNKNTKPQSVQTAQRSISLTDKANSYATDSKVGIFAGETALFEKALPLAYNQGRMHLIYSAPELSSKTTGYSFRLNSKTITAIALSGTLTEVKIK